MLLRKSMLDEVGGFDPRYFLYFEETDLCFRAINTGWQVWAIGEAVADHAIAGSARGLNKLMYHECIAEHYFRSRFYYLTKNHGYIKAAIAELAEILTMLLMLLPRVVTGRRVDETLLRLRSPMFRKPKPDSGPRERQ